MNTIFEQIRDAILSCAFDDPTANYDECLKRLSSLSNAELLRGIERHHDGGLQQFLLDLDIK